MQATTSYRLSHLSHALLPGLLLGVGMSGCNFGTGTTATGGLADHLKSRVLKCSWKDPNGGHQDPNWTYERKFCIKSGGCNAYLFQFCAYNIDGDENQYLPYTPDGPNGEGDAVWDGFCDESCPSGVEAGRAPPYCEGVDPVPYDPAVYGACEPPTESTTGAPTTGEDPTGGAGTDSDGPNIEVWLCSEVAHQNCQQRSGSGQNADDDHCWSISETTARCVTAATQADAEAACECLCSVTDDSYSFGCDNPGICEVDTHLDCDAPYTDYPTPLGLTTHTCNGVTDGAVATGMCPNNFKLFDASASLVLADGTSTAVTGIAGYLHYTVSGCAGGTCDFELDVLEIPAEDVSGVYYQGSTVGGSYSIDALGVHMKNSLEGTWRPTRQTITFGGNPFWAVATMTDLAVDSLALPADPLTFGTNQIVGNLNSTTSELTLNFAFSVPGGTASFSLTTH